MKERFIMKKIFEPVEMKGLTARNRLVRSATWEGIANPDGSVTEEAYEIYEELANAGSAPSKQMVQTQRLKSLMVCPMVSGWALEPLRMAGSTAL